MHRVSPKPASNKNTLALAVMPDNLDHSPPRPRKTKRCSRCKSCQASTKPSAPSSDSPSARLRRASALATRGHTRHVSPLPSPDDCYSRNRLLDHIDDDGLDRRGAWRLHRPHFFPCTLLRPSPFGLRLRQTFFWRRLGYGPICRFSSRGLGRLERRLREQLITALSSTAAGSS